MQQDALDAGGAHTCAIKTDATTACWGFNSNGQSTVPAGLGSVSAITAGTVHTCAIKSDETATCWGINGYGQASAPAGSFGDRTPPEISSAIAGAEGVGGWRTADVTVTWAVTDPESTASSCVPVTVTTDTPGRDLTCTARSAGGTATRTVTVKRDATPPIVTCPAVSFTPGSPGALTATVTDATSGPAAASVSAAADTTSPGTRIATLTARDSAGTTVTADCSYLVTALAKPRCVTRAQITKALSRALGRPFRIRRATIRYGTARTRVLELNRRRTAVVLPRRIKRGKVRITITYRTSGRTRTLRRTLTAC